MISYSGKRGWNSGFTGGVGKRAWNSGFTGGVGKRAWNSGFTGGVGKRAWNSGFTGGVGKRAWNSGFTGGVGKRAWNSGFAGSVGKRSDDSDDNNEDDIESKITVDVKGTNLLLPMKVTDDRIILTEIYIYSNRKFDIIPFLRFIF